MTFQSSLAHFERELSALSDAQREVFEAVEQDGYGGLFGTVGQRQHCLETAESRRLLENVGRPCTPAVGVFIIMRGTNGGSGAVVRQRD